MICFISDQVLQNFIPVWEEETRPDILHGFFTPSETRLVEKWRHLSRIVRGEWPDLRLIDEPVTDAFDSESIAQRCRALLAEHPDDEWVLNSTGGTKLMSSPALQVFASEKRRVIYVDTSHGRILELQGGWGAQELPFRGKIPLEHFFGLYGVHAKSGRERTRQEQVVAAELRKLDWDIYPSVELFRPGEDRPFAEYDVVGIDGYRCSVFECKELEAPREMSKEERTRAEAAVKTTLGHDAFTLLSHKERIQNGIKMDLFKLYQVQQHFGGPFGKAYWVLSGGYEMSDSELRRLRDFRITPIFGRDFARIAKAPQAFGLPTAR
jgi:hypothetical protein